VSSVISVVDKQLAQENISPLLPGEGQGEGLFWTLQDRQQSVGDAINATGRVQIHNEYDAFGEQYQTESDFGGGSIADENLLRYAYTCQEQEPLVAGLMYFNRRWYDTASGRFLSEDPSSFSAGDMNLYVKKHQALLIRHLTLGAT
jgi:RHS repeat-associated protein